MPEVIGSSKSIYGFDPRSMGGCILWLDGADPTKLYSDTAGTTLATVGNPVRRWKDKSGQGNDFSNRSANSSYYYPTYASGGGVFIPNSGTPSYNSGTYVLLQSVTNFLAFPYYTVYSVVNPTGGGVLPTIFSCVRDPAAESRSPNIGCGGSFSLGSNFSAYSNARFSFGDYNGVSGLGGNTGEQIASNVISVVGVTSGVLSNNTYRSGTRVGSCGSIPYIPWSTCAAPAFIGGCFYLVNAGAADNRFFDGTIYETLVFNSELTVKQCQEIEGYLSWKWGCQTSLPTTHPFYSIAPLARGFTPLDIPGCRLWLDAADVSSMTLSSSSVTQWNDKSGNARNYTTLGTAPIYSSADGGSVTFSNGQALANSTTWPGNGAGVDLFVVSTPWPYTQYNDWRTLFRGASDGHRVIIEYNSSRLGYYGNTGAGFQQFGSLTLGQVKSLLYVKTDAAFASSAALNGTVALSAASSTQDSDSQAFYCLGAVQGNSQPWGTINEIVIFSNLTTVQRQQVEGYLAWKWGLTAILSTSNLLYQFPPSSIQQFKPTDVNACSLWLDAADPAATGTGSTVTTWLDKSGFGSNATANSGITLVQNAVNGNTVLSVSSGTPQYLNGSITITGTGLTVISAFKMDSGSGGAVRILGLGVAGANDYNNASYVAILRQSSSNMGAYRNGSYAGPLLTYGVPAISTTYFDGTNGYSYINGGTASSIAATANFGITSYSVMANTSNADAHYLTGYMCEMIVYNSTLTLAQRQQVEGYLSKKWNIPLATTHPYYNINPSHMVSGTGIITPSNLPGLIVWNRADTLAVGNGVAVGTWTNSSNASGPTISCSGTQSNAVLNGLSVVDFTTAQTWTSSTALTPSNYTFIQVSRQTPSTYGRVFQSSVSGTNHLHGYWGTLKQPWYAEGWLTWGGAGITSEEREWAIVTGTRIQSGAYECRWNGAIVVEGTSSSAHTLEGLAINTGGAAYAEVSTCQVAEVILYDNILTRLQIIGIEEYLRQKWGLGVN